MVQKIKPGKQTRAAGPVVYCECLNPWDESWNQFKGTLCKVDSKQKRPYILDGVERGFFRVIDHKKEVTYSNKLYIKIN